MTNTNNRQAAYDIDPIFTKRWSPRAFSEKQVSDDQLNQIFEAARWAPSAANIQPWNFIVAKTDADRENFLKFIMPGNTAWCDKAPVLVAAVSKTDTDKFGGGPNASHAFDTGAAWGYLALEAARIGLVSHAMGGFDREAAKVALNLPENYEVQVIIAIGYLGDKASLPEGYQEREVASLRDPIESFVFEGSFSGETE